MMWRHLLAGVVALNLMSTLSVAAEANADPLFARFEGVWKNDMATKVGEAKEETKTTNIEVFTPALRGRCLIGREVSSPGDGKSLFFVMFDPAIKRYRWTFFSTGELMGAEWDNAWDEAKNTLTGKSSDCPPTWTSEGVNHFTSKDNCDVSLWMKNDAGKFVFQGSMKKTRQPAAEGEKMLVRWKEVADAEKPLSPELQVLQRLAGTWDVTAVSKKAEWTPEEKTIKSKVVRSWVLNRTYLQDLSTSDDGTESISLNTFDPKQKEYRAWWFNSEGHTSKSTGQWDEAAKTLRFKATLPGGQTSASSVHITDDDHHEWKVLITDADGKVYFDCDWKCMRAK